MQRVCFKQNGATWTLTQPGEPDATFAAADVRAKITALARDGLVVDLEPQRDKIVGGEKKKVTATDAPAITRAFDERGTVLVVDVAQPPAVSSACAIIDVKTLGISTREFATLEDLAAFHSVQRPAEVIVLREVSQQFIKRFSTSGAKPIVRVIPIEEDATSTDSDALRGAFWYLERLNRREAFRVVVVAVVAPTVSVNSHLIDALTQLDGTFASPARSAEGRDLFRRRSLSQSSGGSLERTRAFFDAVTTDQAIELAQAFPRREIGLADGVAKCLAHKGVNCSSYSIQSARDVVCGLICAIKGLQRWASEVDARGTPFPHPISLEATIAALRDFSSAVIWHADQPKSHGWTFHPGHKEELAKARASNDVVAEFKLVGLYSREWATLMVVAQNAAKLLSPGIVDAFAEQDILVHARAREWCVPTLCDAGPISLTGFRPGATGGMPVSTSVAGRVMITGANESGKSTLLRALATSVLCAYAGLPVRAESCVVPRDIKSVHLWPAHRANVAAAVPDDCLLLVDEFPKFAEETPETLKGAARFIVATHDPRLLRRLVDAGYVMDVRATSHDGNAYSVGRDVFLHQKRLRVCRAEELLDKVFA